MEMKTVTVTTGGKSHDIALRYRPGKDDLVVFIHGLGCSQESFDNVWEQKAFERFSLLSFDLVGFGDSEKPDDFSYTLEDHAGICARVVEHYTFDRLHIAAHSMGGAIGLLLPDRLFRKIRAFANLEGNLIFDDCGLLSRDTEALSYDAFRDNIFRHLSSRLSPGEYRCLDLAKASPLAFYNSAKSLVSWSGSGHLLERFRKISCRKAYFYGAYNSGMKVLGMLGGIEMRKIDRSGHFLMNDNPDFFYSELFDFFTREA